MSFFRLSCLAIWIVLGAMLPATAAAQDDLPHDAAADELATLRREIADLRRAYEERLTALEARLEQLEGEKRPATSPGDELARLRAAAAAAAPPAAEPPAAEAAGRQRNLNRLNPEISFTANLLGTADRAAREEFALQEFELDLQASLDPYSRTRFTLAVGEEGVEVEEGYVAYSSLPGGLSLTAGKFRQSFGNLNRQHLHALPQVEYPRVLTTYFGEEGLGQTGLSFQWLLPRGWADANEITLQVTDGSSEVFGGEDFEHLSLLARVKNYWDVGAATYFEWGLSAIVGDAPGGGDGVLEGSGNNRVLGTDLTLHWQPPGRSRYRELTWRSELLRSERYDDAGTRQEAWGGYSYLEGLARRGLVLGLRYDRVEDPLDPAITVEGLSPYLTWWQSEFVRLRAQAEIVRRRGEDDEKRFLLQLTWAAGPHKHETY